jgi:hypothetical protein
MSTESRDIADIISFAENGSTGSNLNDNANKTATVARIPGIEMRQHNIILIPRTVSIGGYIAEIDVEQMIQIEHETKGYQLEKNEIVPDTDVDNIVDLGL